MIAEIDTHGGVVSSEGDNSQMGVNDRTAVCVNRFGSAILWEAGTLDVYGNK